MPTKVKFMKEGKYRLIVLILVIFLVLVIISSATLELPAATIPSIIIIGLIVLAYFGMQKKASKADLILAARNVRRIINTEFPNEFPKLEWSKEMILGSIKAGEDYFIRWGSPVNKTYIYNFSEGLKGISGKQPAELIREINETELLRAFAFDSKGSKEIKSKLEKHGLEVIER